MRFTIFNYEYAAKASFAKAKRDKADEEEEEEIQPEVINDFFQLPLSAESHSTVRLWFLNIISAVRIFTSSGFFSIVD